MLLFHFSNQTSHEAEAEQRHGTSFWTWISILLTIRTANVKVFMCLHASINGRTAQDLYKQIGLAL